MGELDEAGEGTFTLRSAASLPSLWDESAGVPLCSGGIFSPPIAPGEGVAQSVGAEPLSPATLIVFCVVGWLLGRVRRVASSTGVVSWGPLQRWRSHCLQTFDDCSLQSAERSSERCVCMLTRVGETCALR